MKYEPNGLQGIINKLNGLSKVIQNDSIAQSYGVEPEELTLEAIRQYIAIKITDANDVYVRCEDALNRMSHLDFSRPIETDDSETAGNYIANSLNILMEELS